MTVYNQQVVNLAFKYINDLTLAWASNTTLSVSSGQCRDSQNVYDIVISSAITINSAVNGANGLDTGSLAASTWYAVHAIGDSTNYNDGATILSLSATAPYLPAGYDVQRRIGWVRTDGSSHFLVFYQDGKGDRRDYFWDAVITVLNASGSDTYDDVDCSGAMPSTSKIAKINWTFNPATQTNVFTVRPTGSSSTTGPTGQAAVISVNSKGFAEFVTNSSQSLDYITTHANDDLTLGVMGFVDAV